MSVKKLLPKVSSLMELETRAKGIGWDAEHAERYTQLAIIAAQNLGGRAPMTLAQAMSWLRLNANETTERGVVKEVNFVRDCVK